MIIKLEFFAETIIVLASVDLLSLLHFAAGLFEELL